MTTELKRRGIGSDEKVTLTIEPELFPCRRESRKLVIAAGLTDDDIDRLIEKAREEVIPAKAGIQQAAVESRFSREPAPSRHSQPPPVMTGLVPVIHDFAPQRVARSLRVSPGNTGGMGHPQCGLV